MVLYGLVLTVAVFRNKIVSVNLGLHPLATLIAMYAGLRTMGLVGLLMGPILLIALQAVIKTGVLGLGPKTGHRLISKPNIF